MENKTIRWGIAGLGNIAHRFAADLTQHTGHGVLQAVAARDARRAKEFSTQYQCALSYSSYAELADNPDVDAVYVATIHPYHKDLVKLFLLAGKHVLVEKPAFTNRRDWDEMFSLAQQKQVLLVEAMKTVAFPAYRQLRQFIEINDIVIHSVEAAFGSENMFDASDRLFDPTLSGGATLDVGVYALWLYADLCQLRQIEIEQPSVIISKDNSDSMVDENVEFQFQGKLKAIAKASITRSLSSEARIRGPEVDITIHGKWWNPQTIDIKYQGQHQQISIPAQGGGFEFEIEHFNSLIISNKLISNVIPPNTSGMVISLMESALIDNGFEYLVNPA